MNFVATLRKTFVTSPLPAAVAYAGLVFALLFTLFTSLADILGQRAEVAASAAMLEQLEGRTPAAARGQPTEGSMPSGSAFLEGATVTVAGAVLIQRVAGAVTKFGGNVLSTQVELKGTQSKAGFLSILASCEIEQVGLQQLLYDLEAGMPFLFIDQLVVQAPHAVQFGQRKIADSAGGVRAMAGSEMMLRLTIGVMLVVTSTHAIASTRRGHGSAGYRSGRRRTRGISSDVRHFGATRRARADASRDRTARARASSGTGAERQSIMGHPSYRLVGHARPADLLAVAAAAGPCGRTRSSPEGGRCAQAKGTGTSATQSGGHDRKRR